MNKYFLFNKEQVGPSSTDASDTGVGVSVLSIPVSSLSYMTATSGFVNLVFNNSGIFEHVDLVDGESIKKTTVNVQCVVGEEAKLVEDITNFITSTDTNQRVMKFDFVNSFVSFLSAELQTPKSIFARIHSAPEDLNEKNILINPSGLTSFIVNGIQFKEDTYPIIDLDAADISNFTGYSATGGTFSTWENSSQLAGATAYYFSVGPAITSPTIVGDELEIDYGYRDTNGLATRSVDFSGGEDIFADPPLEIAQAFSGHGDYTIYLVVGYKDTDISSLVSISEIYGSTWNFGPFDPDQGSTFSTRHALYAENGTIQPGGVPPKTKTNAGLLGTTPYTFPNKDQTCYVFIIRRDKNFNIFLHNHLGDIVGLIPSMTEGSISKPFRTDGTLLIESLGMGRSDTKSKSFKGHLARFGVIEKDIGASEAARLAIALYERYKPLG
jgi:hypothetical protein